MPKRSAIEVVEERDPAPSGEDGDDSCPACGAPHGKFACQKCGFGVEDLAPQFGENILDPVTTIRDARLSFQRMKDEIAYLKNINQLMMQNNQKFVELIEILRALVTRLSVEAGKKYVYSYAEGGWGEAGADGKMAIALKKEVTVEDINMQLAEIVRLISRYKK